MSLRYQKVDRCLISDRFKLYGLIGSGSFAKVYSAYDSILKQDCALKIVCLAINNKFRISEGLRHWAIQRQVLSCNDTAWNVIEYFVHQVKNCSNIKNNNLNWNSASKLFLHKLHQLSSIQHLHSIGYAHSDLKLENIVLKSSDFSNFDSSMICIIDLGHASLKQPTKMILFQFFIFCCFCSEANYLGFNYIHQYYSASQTGILRQRSLYEELIYYIDLMKPDEEVNYTYILSRMKKEFDGTNQKIDWVMDWSHQNKIWTEQYLKNKQILDKQLDPNYHIQKFIRQQRTTSQIEYQENQVRDQPLEIHKASNIKRKVIIDSTIRKYNKSKLKREMSKTQEIQENDLVVLVPNDKLIMQHTDFQICASPYFRQQPQNPSYTPLDQPIDLSQQNELLSNNPISQNVFNNGFSFAQDLKELNQIQFYSLDENDFQCNLEEGISEYLEIQRILYSLDYKENNLKILN
ncbi:serine threonine-protein kinase [Stylonychia lemnae]|uniref:Serine threonine-protein kinase n=1 Tax=Stylonychia lemnae TaxID=5949 RepID=A0A078BE58_STYLE|nr:serine threonine-protein kinase [Stylonychia lemnae]|eukprot:CDW91427.1 serine threonine-protein kinase [Stylonychia lemnae]